MVSLEAIAGGAVVYAEGVWVVPESLNFFLSSILHNNFSLIRHN